MHICSKFDGGKQINRSQAGSGKVGVLEQGYVVMKELDGDQQHGRKLSTESHLMSSSLLQQMPLNALTRIASVRLQLLQSYNAKRHDIVQLQ